MVITLSVSGGENLGGGDAERAREANNGLGRWAERTTPELQRVELRRTHADAAREFCLAQSCLFPPRPDLRAKSGAVGLRKAS